MSRRSRVSGLAAGASLIALILLAPALGAVIDTLPTSLTDREFWSLTEQLSEPNGSFQSDNLLSNELGLSSVANLLTQRVKRDGVYLGVGPEQNYTYIAAMRPKIAFITDIRRGNLHMHLMYKALFELSADRAEFVSRLFTKPRPVGLTGKSTAGDLMNAYWDIETSTEPIYQANLQAIKDVLMKKHGFPLSAEDIAGIEYVYHAFYWYGPRITYSSSTAGVNARGTNYADLMMVLDSETSTEQSYLSSEDRFLFLKSLHSSNLVVPVVGDFAGPKALRAVGKYVRDHGAVVSAFYVSNVESYLQRNGAWANFCANVASMPLDDQSVFIRPGLGGAIYYFNTAVSTNGTVQFITRSGTNTLPGANAAELQRVLSAVSGPGRTSPLSGMAAEVAACGSR